jgi:predicted transposase/invertase (TIGR01784 family)
MRLKETETKIDKLPSVFPIMVYSGLEKWTAPTSLAELIENNELLGEFALNFNYFKIAENEVSVTRLQEIGNVVSTLFLGEVHYDRTLLIQALSELPKREERQLVSLLFNYFEQLFNHNKLGEVDWRALDKVRSDQEINMFLENMKICDETAYQKGRLEGKQEGKLEGKLETAKVMLLEGLSISLIMKVTGLSMTEIEQLRH